MVDWYNLEFDVITQDDDGNDLILPKSEQIPRDFFKKVKEEGLTKALSDRDSKYGDYRENKKKI